MFVSTFEHPSAGMLTGLCIYVGLCLACKPVGTLSGFGGGLTSLLTVMVKGIKVP